MNQFEMILGIVVIVMIASVVKAAFKFKADRQPPSNDPDSVRLKEEVRALRERIHVLERIATDKESALEREIDRLRDH